MYPGVQPDASGYRPGTVSDAFYRPRGGVRALGRRDPRLRDLLRDVGPVAIAQKSSTFETIARSIAYQQLTGKAARTIWERVLRRFDGEGLQPERVLRTRLETLRRAGLSRAKAASLKDLARHVVDGRLEPERLPELDDEEVMVRLTRVKGIGPWSAHMHLIFALARPDVWPVGDLGVRKGLARFLDLPAVPDAKEAARLGEAWAPWRTIVAWAMWRIQDAPDDTW